MKQFVSALFAPSTGTSVARADDVAVSERTSNAMSSRRQATLKSRRSRGTMIGIGLAASAFYGQCAHGGGWTSWAMAEQVDIVRNEGVMVHGNFGNPGGCSATNQFLIAFAHPNFREFYSAILMAQASGKLISVYVQQCDPVTWYADASYTFGALRTDGAVRTKD